MQLKEPYAPRKCIKCNEIFQTYSQLEFDSEELCPTCRKPPFICRICGHDEFSSIYPSDYPIGVIISPTSYYCENCSTIFRNPKKFSK